MDVIFGCPLKAKNKKSKLNPVAELQLQGALAKLKRGRNTLPPKVYRDIFLGRANLLKK